MKLFILHLLVAICLSGDARVVPAYSSLLQSKNEFVSLLQDMDESLDRASCKYLPDIPNTVVKGRRISEIKCLEYIWNIKYDEALKKMQLKCTSDGGSGVDGGDPTYLGEYPHMGAIGYADLKNKKWAFKCGGSLISEQFVLTAAHCEREPDYEKEPKIVRFGTVDITNDKLRTDIKIKYFKPHPKWKGGYRFKDYDIALIRLKRKVVFNIRIQPACILAQNNVKKATITGWGAVSENNDKPSNELLKASVHIHSNMKCKEDWKIKHARWKNYFNGWQLCASGDNHSDICEGDSGGPLQTKLIQNKHMSIHNIVGIASFTSGESICGNKQFPSVYTKVHYYIKWIEKEVWGTKNKHLI